jgi:hypothetical protein
MSFAYITKKRRKDEEKKIEEGTASVSFFRFIFNLIDTIVVGYVRD